MIKGIGIAIRDGLKRIWEILIEIATGMRDELFNIFGIELPAALRRQVPLQNWLLPPASVFGGGGTTTNNQNTYNLTVNTNASYEDIINDFNLMQSWSGR